MTTSLKFWHWAPRIICILAILFVSLFALDAFDDKLTIWQQIGGFLIHMIPSFILLGVLLVAWKWEKAGGVILIILGLVLSILVFRMNYRINNSVWTSIGVISAITIPFVIAGILFLISYIKKKDFNKLH